MTLEIYRACLCSIPAIHVTPKLYSAAVCLSVRLPLVIARSPNISVDNETNVPKIAKTPQRPQTLERERVAVVASANALKKRSNSGDDGGVGGGERETDRQRDAMRAGGERSRIQPQGQLSRLFQNDNTGCSTLTL